MRISGMGNVSAIQSRQPSQDRVVIRPSTTSKDKGEAAPSVADSPKVDGAADDGHGQVEAYRALERQAPVERRPEAAFQRLDINGDGALSASELEANSASISEVLNRRVTPEQLLRELDTDADGKLGQGEVKGLERRRTADVGTAASDTLPSTEEHFEKLI